MLSEARRGGLFLIENKQKASLMSLRDTPKYENGRLITLRDR
jgi:hypothetical protein